MINQSGTRVLRKIIMLRSIVFSRNDFLTLNSPLNSYRTMSNAVNLSRSEFFHNDTLQTLSPVIILHGLLGSKMNWKSLAATIAQRSKRKVFTLDARNHGDSPHTKDTLYSSMVADVLLFLQNNTSNKCIVLGHSMGGRTAMLIALQNPDVVEKLVVVDIAPITYKGSGINSTQLILTSMKNAIKEIKGNENLSQARRIVDKILAKNISDLSLRQFILTNLVEKNGIITWRVNYDLLENNYKDIMVFPEITRRYLGQTLVIAGGKSDYIKPDMHPEIHKYFPNAVIEYVPDAGHWVHAEKPNEFLNLLLPFLNKA